MAIDNDAVTEVNRLNKMVEDMTMAAARSAIALLHSFGLSGQEAEDMVNGKNQPEYTIQYAKHSGDINIVKVVSDSVRTFEEVQVCRSTFAHAGMSVYGDAVFQFDRLLALGQRIEKLKYGNRTYYGIMARIVIDDCTYRCSVDYFEENK